MWYTSLPYRSNRPHHFVSSARPHCSGDWQPSTGHMGSTKSINISASVRRSLLRVIRRLLSYRSTSVESVSAFGPFPAMLCECACACPSLLFSLIWFSDISLRHKHKLNTCQICQTDKVLKCSCWLFSLKSAYWLISCHLLKMNLLNIFFFKLLSIIKLNCANETSKLQILGAVLFTFASPTSTNHLEMQMCAYLIFHLVPLRW